MSNLPPEQMKARLVRPIGELPLSVVRELAALHGCELVTQEYVARVTREHTRHDLEFNRVSRALIRLAAENRELRTELRTALSNEPWWRRWWAL